MTETEKKALTLLNEVCAEMGLVIVSSLEVDMPGERALLRAIEQHEAFRQEVSDAVTGFDEYGTEAAWEKLSRFIIPKPDPLVEVVNEAWGWRNPHPDVTENLRAALAARGLEIREVR